MSRFPRTLLLLVVCGVMSAGVLALGQEAKPAGRGGQVAKPVKPQMPALPGFWQLRMKNVQEDLELVPEQIEELKALGKEYYEQMRAHRGDYKDWSSLSQEERQAKYKEIRERRKVEAEALRKKIEKVLLPHQLKALRDINLRSIGPSMLQQPRIAEKIGLSDEQKADIRKLREKLMADYRKLQKESFEKIFELLTPDQREKLRESIQNRGY